MTKETKAQRVERIKKEKDGLDVISDIYRYAKTNEEIDPEDIDRLKWYGFYTQNRNLQDKDDDTLYFMLRIKLEGGVLDIEKLKAITNITKLYTKGTADFTVRQTIQVHFVKMSDIPAIFEELANVGISTVYSSGDVPRNIISCPINEIDPDHIADVSHIVDNLNELYVGNREFSNLPRKFKVGVNGCSLNCTNHEIQDLNFNAKKDENDELIFSVHVGGGLASNKRVSSYLGDIKEEQILDTAKNVALIYRDFGNRENRRKARVGHLVEEFGVEKFKQTLEEKQGFKFINNIDKTYTHSKQRDHYGIHDSNIEGKSYIGFCLYGGHIGYTGLKALLDVCEKYGATKLKSTVTQNLIILDAPTAHAEEIVDELEEFEISAYPSNFKARTQACTGIDFCKLAVAETKGVAKKLVQHLDKKFPNFKQRITISVNGCINSCSHPHIVDFGLIGTKVRKDGKPVEGYELLVGGFLQGESSVFGQKTALKFVKEEVNEGIEKLIEEYINSDYENIDKFLETKIK